MGGAGYLAGMLNVAVCERARRARDPRFDGRFFVGVLTTKVYCRPICPVALPKAENVRFYPSAAAASEAGFRPCLRCRPEATPGSPAWRGSAATVTRALRLIDDGALDRGGVDALAERLGVGSRHLARLFNEHLGASPVAVAQTRRLHFAKQLIDETDLPMTQVAMSAGFGSLRRFNTLFRTTYGKSPSALRGRRGEAEDVLTLRLSYRPPLDFGAMLGFLASHGVPAIEQVSGLSYRRTVEVGGEACAIEVRWPPGQRRGRAAGDASGARRAHLELRLPVAAAGALADVAARARATFDLDANPAFVAEHLAGDARLRGFVRAHAGKLRVPGAWDRFEMAVRAILGQGVSVAAARTFTRRLVERYGRRVALGVPGLTHLFPDAGRLARARVERIGITGARAAAIRALARAVASGELDLGSAQSSDLLALPGVGPWTAQYVALRALGEPDAFPAGDLVLRRAMRDGAGRAPSIAALEQLSQRWRPWRGYAAMALWQLANDSR